MSDLISRSELIEDIKRRKYIDKPLEEIFETIIDEQPTVEPKRGEWIDMRESYKDIPQCKCSACGCFRIGLETNFCPHCGADMRKKVQNELGR